jgi:hypothetical protein
MSDPSIARTVSRSQAEARRTLPIVHLRYQGHPVGLYGVRALEPHRLSVCHGAVSLPVGTQVLVEDLLGLVPGVHARMLPAEVIENNTCGMSLSL